MELLTPKELAARLKVSPSTLRHWRKKGKGPPVLRVGPSTYRYSVEAVETYMANGGELSECIKNENPSD